MKHLILSTIFFLMFITNKGFTENKFDPAIIVNGTTISKFELSQRITLLNIMQSGGDVQKKASNQLINAKLVKESARNYNILISEEEVHEGVSKLAGGYNLSVESFLTEVSKTGIASQTINTFVKERILLRELVQYKFANRASIDDDEIDSFIMNGSATLEINLLEIVLPFNYNNKNEIFNFALNLKNKIAEGVTFESLAKKHSQADSAINGGDIGWIPITQLPSEIGRLFLTSKKNSLIGPNVFDNVIILYRLSDVREVPLFNDIKVKIDYMQLDLPKTSKIDMIKIMQIFENNHNCLNLKFELESYPELIDKLIKIKIEELKIPKGLYEKIKTLDIGEYTIFDKKSLSKNRKFIMLCARQQEITKQDREIAKQYLFSQRLISLADGFIADLKAEATVVYK